MARSLIRRGAIAGATVIGLEAAYAVLRPVPILPDFDPSGHFGDPSSPPLRVAVLGDSSVTGPGVDTAEEIWVSRVCTRLGDTHHVELRSFAIGGSMAHDLVEGQLEDAILFGPDLVFVSVGANDVLKGVSRRRFAANLEHLVAELADTGAIVVQSGVGVIGTIPRIHSPLSTLVSRRARRFDRVHWQVARRHGTHVVDQRSDDPNVWNRDRSLWAADYFHVSASGHARWAETVWRTVGPLYEGTDGPG